ncbi:FkbM family methyltransferase [Paenibacillus massiliensis]|uniref:FkbM family methyltransferase n=1 Tax=Paenibacillus massiliensis TaxID=225917 RepID=UPI00040AF953|nr:FkbM family methyltransferase [Paenibacillus massiliensis]
MHGTYIGNNKMLVKLAFNAMLTISSNDYSLMPILVTSGAFEAPLTKYFIKHVKPGNVVVDVGTNVGYFTLLSAKLVGTSGKVIGYEANPEMYSFAQDNIAMNWLTDQVTLVNKAIYSENRQLQFQTSERFHGYSSINERPTDELVRDQFTCIEVEAVTLDSELEAIDRIDLLKIDIEGGEYQAFLGAIDSIKSKKIRKISFEWNKPMLGGEAEPFIYLLSDILNVHGGKLFLLNAEGDPTPATLKEITAVDFYPFVLIEFN